VRIYFAALSFSGLASSQNSPVLRSNTICFAQPGAPAGIAAAARKLPAQVHECVSVYFVGTQADFEDRLKRVNPFGTMVRVRFDLLLRVLRALKAIVVLEM
jgi:hypothetical protein